MMRTALFSLLAAFAATACTGDIIGDMPDDPNDPNDPNNPPPPPTTVKVRITEGGAPVSQMPIVFQNADESVVLETSTAADGSAVAEMPNGGIVSIIRLRADDANGNPVPPEVYTYVGVKAGDVLDLRGTPSVPAPPTTITVKVPATENGAVTVYTPCGTGAGAPPEVQVQISGCAPGAEIGFYVNDAANTSFFKRATLGTTVDLSTEAYKDQIASTVTATNISETQVTLSKHLESDGYVFFTSPPAPGPTADITTPDALGAEQVITVSYAGATGSQMIAKHEPFAAAPSTIDVLADQIAYTTPATMAPDTGNLTWTESGPGLPDITQVKYSIAREGVTFTRMIVAPHTPNAFTLPKLPATYDGFNYKMGDQASATHALAKFSTGYDTVRNTIFNRKLSSSAPMGGRAVVSYAAGQGEIGGADGK